MNNEEMEKNKVKKEKKANKERNHKLIIEVGIIALLFFAATLFFTLYSDYVITKDAYLSSKNELIERDLTNVRTKFMQIKNIGWVLDNLKRFPDSASIEVTEDEEELFMDPEVYKKLEDLIHGNLNPEDVDSTMQNLYVKHIYSILALTLSRDEETENGIWLMGILNDDQSILYMDDMTYESYGDSEVYMELMDYRSSEHSAVKELLSDNGKTDGKVFYETYYDEASGHAYYNGYLIVNKEAGAKCVLCVRYDWTDFHNKLYDNAKQSMIVGFLVLLVLNGLLMLFIYKKVISPVLKVKSGVSEYMEDKDSDAVTEKMNDIKVRNEIGVLADSFSDLATEMERYTEEIVILNDEKTRIKTELGLAKSIQSSMLPSNFPAFPNRKEFDIYASMDPAKEVGGDFYDFFLIDEDHLCMMIADVSGKGVPAALFMMSSKIILENQSIPGKTPAQILTDANKIIFSNNKEKMFVTVWLGILELSTGKLSASNAGHEYPAIKDESGSFSLYKDKHGLVIGARATMSYTDYEIVLKPGDKIFVYTDGVAEASNSKKELFGTDRMVEALNKKPDVAPEELLALVREEVDAFVKNAEQFDDLTMLCLEYHGPAK